MSYDLDSVLTSESVSLATLDSDVDSQNLTNLQPRDVDENDINTKKLQRRESINELARRESIHSLYPDQINLDQLSRQSSRKNEVDLTPVTDNSCDDGGSLDSFDPNEVILEVGDKYDMYLMPVWRKWIITITLALIGLDICILSSCWSLVSPLQTKYKVSHEVFVLGVSFYIFGMACGPLFLSPLSETYGRRATYITGLLFCIIFQILTCFVHNYGCMIFSRYVTGLFGSVFLSVAPGTISDIFTKQDIGIPLSIYSLSPFLGPSLGPLLAGIVTEYTSGEKYMWTFYSILIFTCFLLAVLVIVVPETYQPVLLKWKAEELRKTTGNQDLYAPLHKAEIGLFTAILQAPKRPLLVLVKDPMMTVLCFYSGLILGIVYLFFVSIPYTFRTVWGFNTAQQGLAFLGMTIGMMISSILSRYFSQLYLKLSKKNGKPEPEFRFPSLICGGIFAPISLFILAFTTYKQCHWVGAIVASGCFGLSTGLIISSIFTYTADAYRLYAASAAAANTFARCSMAAIFPLFGLQLYEKLGVHYASLLLGCIALLLTPVPFLFYKYGKSLRQKSPYAWVE
ncbi:hypothetical protein CANARDRAFT_194838 [[Candida] arabinofermentans NRRL YB-2248]|uniref:Major facilitator superfamily (MFS) profile domain-containing protein n=1 Tax=[Candida] arabinofermentans NRRL YB-2248 TaxID=983967 RepID=A0A1E4T5V8_9ASCO|nr:hypothetical protein CANARDRAFT_194838 [[Candida] arabinofermentans NRRL YB-2248]